MTKTLSKDCHTRILKIKTNKIYPSTSYSAVMILKEKKNKGNKQRKSLATIKAKSHKTSDQILCHLFFFIKQESRQRKNATNSHFLISALAR